jgi:hypothetical protein
MSEQRDFVVDWRFYGLCVVAIAAVVAMFQLPPIPQDPAYHDFADQRSWLGIPNFGDVASNLPYALVGLFGLYRLWRIREAVGAWSRFPYLHLLLFFAVLSTIAAGSAYYHLAPDNETLFWDRLPITLAFMILFSLIVGERVDLPVLKHWPLPVMILAGLAALVYWSVSEQGGQGDLRAYILVQALPLLLAPLLVLFYRRGDVLGNSVLILMVLLYLAAKVVEFLDAAVLQASLGLISGHSLKHLLSAVAPALLLYTPAMHPDRLRTGKTKEGGHHAAG